MNFNTDIGEQVGSLRPRRQLIVLAALGAMLFLQPTLCAAASLKYLERTAPDFLDQAKESYGEMVNIAALLHDYDEKLILAVIVVESEGNETATSHRGAQGLMQLMPATAKAMGAKNPKEPFQNILAGTKYLKVLETNYGFNSPQEALVAYNMGPTRAKRWLSQYDATDYGYVQKVMYVHSLLVREEKDNQSFALADEVNAKKTINDGVLDNLSKPLLTRPRSLSLAELPLTLPVLRRAETASK